MELMAGAYWESANLITRDGACVPGTEFQLTGDNNCPDSTIRGSIVKVDAPASEAGNTCRLSASRTLADGVTIDKWEVDVTWIAVPECPLIIDPATTTAETTAFDIALGGWEYTGDLIADDGTCARGNEVEIDPATTTCSGDWFSFWYSELELAPTEFFDVGSCVVGASRLMADGTTATFSATVNVTTGEGSGSEGFAAMLMRLQTAIIVQDIQG